ncbi:hypothetical protein HYPSUDRAFT_44848 [Hypholoma sublateritium FD-334 SS-4]|uniref:Secreted protein n=1 Tax=Hypholoma sublateritium (strain FD-334 SS-4) TaxID=945553 RepID=A0A0D2NIZ2_HYPSF|nr:hypothetical protein HYPSUDRAFT_44848 [Hypholoma sublateritium FD-334 SS-4]
MAVVALHVPLAALLAYLRAMQLTPQTSRVHYRYLAPPLHFVCVCSQHRAVRISPLSTYVITSLPLNVAPRSPTTSCARWYSLSIAE